MKYLFFLVLLGNIVFFLWEINNGVEITDKPRELSSAEKEKLILLLSDIDIGVTTDKINTKIENILVSPATNEQGISGETATGLQQLPERENHNLRPEQELTQKEVETELSDAVQQERDVNEAPEIETISASEDTVEVQSTNDTEIAPVFDKEQQVENVNPIIQFFSEEPDIIPEQNDKLLSCYEMGPFSEKASLQLWQNQLEEEISILGVQSRDIEEIIDYMVLYPAAETYAKSKQNASRLRELGINDVWLFEKGENRGAISLGLFESKPFAEKARVQYKQDGLIVKIKPRFRDVQRYFISLELDEQQHNKILQLKPQNENMELSSCT